MGLNWSQVAKQVESEEAWEPPWKFSLAPRILLPLFQTVLEGSPVLQAVW